MRSHCICSSVATKLLLVHVHAIYAKYKKYVTQIFAKENFSNLITFGKQS